jgi:organic hydroperoxide reductase OsmC/OhrA
MIQYPLQFSYTSQAAPGIGVSWQTTSPENRESPCAVPPEFEGPGGGYSPEDFFALALLNCFVATFKVIAEKSRVEFQQVSAGGTLTVDRDERGRPSMKMFEIHARITPGASGDVERIKRVFAKTTESCIVANSVKTEVKFSIEFA